MKQLTSATPHAIIMVGIPGAGKSAFAEHFAETFQAPILNTATLQRELKLELAQIEQLRSTILAEYLKTRRTVLVDGHLDSRASRSELIRDITAAGYKPLLVWVQTDTSEAHRRATKQHPVGSGLSSDQFDQAVKAFQPPHIQEKAIVISGKHTYATQLKVVLKQIAQATAHPTVPPVRHVKAQPSAHVSAAQAAQTVQAVQTAQMAHKPQEPETPYVPHSRGITIR